MKINKQLFEDVLSGKLKGTFILRDGSKVSLNKLRYNYSGIPGVDPPLILNQHSYLYTGICSDASFSQDIVDFIPDTNMKENELTIEIPDGKTVDWEESKKQNKIVLKDKQLTYEYVCKKLFENKYVFYTSSNGNINSVPHLNTFFCNENNATTKHQLECILAKNKLANVAKYLNGEWKPSYTSEGHYDAWVLFTTPNKDYIGYIKISNCGFNSNVLFKSEELAEEAIKILGEETVKLALEPLGI